MRKLNMVRSLLKFALTVVAIDGLSGAPAGARAGARANPDQPVRKPLTSADVLAAATPADWRPLDPQSTIYMELPAGRVIIELAPQFAPHYVANVEALAREGYFNG